MLITYPITAKFRYTLFNKVQVTKHLHACIYKQTYDAFDSTVKFADLLSVVNVRHKILI